MIAVIAVKFVCTKTSIKCKVYTFAPASDAVISCLLVVSSCLHKFAKFEVQIFWKLET